MQFFQTRTALVTLVAACLVVLISLSVRQVFGLFFIDFNNDLGISNTEFGLAIGIQMLGWGLSGPIFGAIADKYGGHRAIILAFLFYILGKSLLYPLQFLKRFMNNSKISKEKKKFRKSVINLQVISSLPH